MPDGTAVKIRIAIILQVRVKTEIECSNVIQNAAEKWFGAI